MGARLRPDPLGKLERSPDPLAILGVGWERQAGWNREGGRGREGEGREEKRGRREEGKGKGRIAL